jgi:glucose/arabinose dehydrogenase
MPKRHLIRTLLALASLAIPSASGAQFETLRVATSLDRPVFLTSATGEATRAFIAEQHTGDVRILRLPSYTLENTPFVTVPGISAGNEQGLLGLAFHPDYETNGYFYVYITDPDSRVLRYQVSLDPDVANAGSETQILEFAQPHLNHNAGWIGFGPDGYLYIASGDGGGGYDNGTGHTSGIGNAQDLTNNFLGKIIRVDVDVDDFPMDPGRNYAVPADNPFVGVAGDDEIWAYGLRNPYRASFDRATGDLYIGDVGQETCEELNVQPSTSTGGENYGWRLREGTIQTPIVGGPAPVGAIDPILDYPHPGNSERCSDPGTGYEGFAVTGGLVYRGPIAELQGRYFFADFSTEKVWSLLWDGSAPSSFDGTNYTDLTDHSSDPRFTPDLGSIGSISSFGEDAGGNLYVLDLFGGEVFLVPEPGGMTSRMAGLLCVAALARVRRCG